MLKKIVFGFAALVVVLVVVIALQPSEFRVERSQTIEAPAPVVFAQINDFRNWEAWSPWARLDESMEVDHTGAETGEGAVYTWQGNDDVGQGRMTILESTPSEEVVIKLEFIKPFESTNTTRFVLTPAGENTEVSWIMAGDNTFMSKAFGLFFDMDAAIGADFEKGLAAMNIAAKQAAEKGETSAEDVTPAEVEAPTEAPAAEHDAGAAEDDASAEGDVP
ncbi:SRPBCC family protein [Lujinxingia vulgaris]|uniref:SRPBCC family protein n=1 Tax=Lujinxingia vulgaris TaxID=2600176 RepID=A0A5C6X230_9DELT|nr:SRPBCC family protein [Lujinxingia vulgaris]TXD35202.1 SRPBCC family protein [Lujinxingia vulgaris]